MGIVAKLGIAATDWQCLIVRELTKSGVSREWAAQMAEAFGLQPITPGS